MLAAMIQRSLRDRHQQIRQIALQIAAVGFTTLRVNSKLDLGQFPDLELRLEAGDRLPAEPVAPVSSYRSTPPGCRASAESFAAPGASSAGKVIHPHAPPPAARKGRALRQVRECYDQHHREWIGADRAHIKYAVKYCPGEKDAAPCIMLQERDHQHTGRNQCRKDNGDNQALCQWQRWSRIAKHED